MGVINQNGIAQILWILETNNSEIVELCQNDCCKFIVLLSDFKAFFIENHMFKI